MRQADYQSASPDRILDVVLSVKGRLEPRHLQAAHILIYQLKSPAGRSGGLTGSYKERVDCSSGANQSHAKYSPTTAYIEAVLKGMRTEERALFNYLMFGQGAGPGEKISLRSFGKRTSKYSSPDHCSAFATGLLRGMLDGVADYFIRSKVMQSEQAAA